MFISHDLAAVYRLCDRALLLNHGSILVDGPPRQVIDHYQEMTFADQGTSLEEVASSQLAQCTSITFSASDSPEIRTGHPMTACLGYRASSSVPNAVFRVSIYWPSGYLCTQLTTEANGRKPLLAPGAGTIEFRCSKLPIVPGLYRVDLSIESNGNEIDLRQRCATLRVEPGEIVYGDFFVDNTWEVSEPVSHPMTSKAD